MNNQMPQHLVRKPNDNYMPPVRNASVTLQGFLNGAAIVITAAMTALDAYTRLHSGRR